MICTLKNLFNKIFCFLNKKNNNRNYNQIDYEVTGKTVINTTTNTT